MVAYPSIEPDQSPPPPPGDGNGRTPTSWRLTRDRRRGSGLRLAGRGFQTGFGAQGGGAAGGGERLDALA
jgi:hypothetical protein